ncbi:helix-hairpin-helix domain-containing protein [Litchfieldia salsa]|uniref:Competence protein ComEA n=1 Tax=Litchfieldia salsa TaxID=930152 RepID=A0A1H0V887_9BACI|nr:helix-hairpin-helix domain-containing protein [Litchfieldia salsa]SDP74769.1 competence protein ComEA [Litchfieldia salsa]
MFTKWTSKKWMLTVFSVLFIAALFCYTTLQRQQDQSMVEEEFNLEQTLQSEEDFPTEDTATKIVIDVKGEVMHPGVYELEQGERLQDAIRIAGGSTKNADLIAVNLAAMLHDEMVVYVPKLGEVVEQPVVEMFNNDGQGEKVSINSSTIEELQQLTGIGPSKAEAIKNFIEENGPIKSIDELLNVSGIGEKTLEKIKDEVTVQ